MKITTQSVNPKGKLYTWIDIEEENGVYSPVDNEHLRFISNGRGFVFWVHLEDGCSFGEPTKENRELLFHRVNESVTLSPE